MSLTESLKQTVGGSGVTAGDATMANLGQALARGTITAVELTSFYLARIERLNPALNAVITVDPAAVAEAAASDARRGAGTVRGPLEGIPVLIKDNVSAAGVPATAGSPALLGAEAADAFLVTRLRAAGAVILGKANLSEWANFRSRPSSSGLSALGGQAVNPHGSGRSPSGSSSGSAIAVAAGLAPVAVGTETDGSIVSPAAACGVVGIKPTVGLVSRSGIVPISAAQDTAGPMASTVADAAILLAAMAGGDPADPATEAAAAHATDYASFLDPAGLDGARLGVWRAGSAQAGAATIAVLEAALAALRGHGAVIVDPVELAGADQLGEPEFAALTHEFKHDINAYLSGVGGDHPADLAGLIAYNSRNAAAVLDHFGQELFEAAEATSGDLGDAGYLDARSTANRIARDGLDAALAANHLDALITLTGHPAWLIDHVLGDYHAWGTSGPAAVSGYPSITVPAGQVSGLPVGLSFIGPAWSEPRLIELAHAFELARQR
ncbi:MAG TPA: amidase [Streptosporangiaceae bacterium]|nr:amidase [Streptosporangiaceae bacterium]